MILLLCLIFITIFQTLILLYISWLSIHIFFMNLYDRKIFEHKNILLIANHKWIYIKDNLLNLIKIKIAKTK